MANDKFLLHELMFNLIVVLSVALKLLPSYLLE